MKDKDEKDMCLREILMYLSLSEGNYLVESQKE